MTPAAGRLSVVVMFTNVIVGVDGHSGGRDATALARHLTRDRLTLVGAYPHDPLRIRGSLGGFEEIQRGDTERDLEECRAAAGVEATMLAIGDSEPARALREVTVAEDADLLVIGSAHHGRVGRLFLGDVGREVLHESPCPVAVAPRGFAGHAPRRVIVGHDGSDESRAAVDLAAALAADLGAALTVCVAWQDPPAPSAAAGGFGAAYPVLASDLRDSAQHVLDRVLAELPARTEGRLVHGSAAPVLEQQADADDLLVVGSRRTGTLRRITLGSTSDHLVHHAACPVLVVPRPEPSTDPRAAPAPATGVVAGDAGRD